MAQMTEDAIDVTPGLTVEVRRDSQTFQDIQKERIRGLQKKMEEEVLRKKLKWEMEVGRMRDEFLKLYPEDRKWPSLEEINEPLVLKRRGSTDVLDVKRMKTLFLEYPSGGRFFKLRFDMEDYDKDTININVDGDRIVVRATKEDDTYPQERSSFVRKIEKPRDVDISKLRSFLTSDGVLIIEAPMPPRSLNIKKFHHSPSTISRCRSSPPSSPTNSSPQTPSHLLKPNIPTFSGQNGERRMSLLIEIGKCFKPKEIAVQILKSDRIMVRAKHEEKTKELQSKSKFSKDYDLSEPIERYTLRAGLTEDGRLLIGALGKNHDAITKLAAVEQITKDIAARSSSCNVLDFANFPPAVVPQI
ncbi:DgyrCDS2577 [Dimorphilus gyrociliatus]|nr:DgyrCDS2577 [Dimorphilus gyrociliatus]